jgi:hypothetical protein
MRWLLLAAIYKLIKHVGPLLKAPETVTGMSVIELHVLPTLSTKSQ